MPQNRTLTVDFNGGTTEVLYVVGTQLTINLYRYRPGSSCLMISQMPFLHMNKTTYVPYSIDISSDCLTEISLDVDADRDGVVEKNNPNKASWKWGPGGHGAILLVNCDCDSGKRPDNEKNYVDLKDMSQMVLRTVGPKELPKGHKLMLHMSAPDAAGARVYNKLHETKMYFTYFNLGVLLAEGYCLLMLDSGILAQETAYTKETIFYVEGVKFADKDFAGLVRIHVSLLQPGTRETPIYTDTVQFKMAPWIMTPNLQAPVKVYVCSTHDNAKFLDGMKTLVGTVGCELHVITETVNRGDRWIQDEMEFGYVHAPHKTFPVVLDSPRDRALDNFPYNELLGPDFGYVTFNPPRDEVNSLESFGNLEVSPPVTVNGKSYPLGRIIIGGAFPFQTDGRNMSSVTQNFLRSVPVLCGFRLLLASPHAAYKLFQGLQETGHGQAKFFEGHECLYVKITMYTDDTVTDVLFSQTCIDWNRDRLKNELELDEDDIVDIPVLFKSAEYKSFKTGKGAVSYYPDTVNMIVLGKNLGIAKPFGPKVDGKCAVEKEVVRLLEPLGLICNFIDDFTTYHLYLGDVHCGSNVRRKAFNFKWWEMEM
uniref:Protein-arginine deiminase n=1 Tax=Neogobius melanostomus TaxID=47308 RepID=A0A8C6WF41_9GOBI